MLLHHMNWILPGLIHWIEPSAPGTNCSELLSKLIASLHSHACLHCLSLCPLKMSEGEMMTNEGRSTQLWQPGAECTLHLSMFLYNLQPTGFVPRTFTRLPTTRKLNRGLLLLVRVSSCCRSLDTGKVSWWNIPCIGSICTKWCLSWITFQWATFKPLRAITV